MILTHITNERHIVGEIVFRCYDTDPLSRTITNDYKVQIMCRDTNVEFEWGNYTCQHLQGIKALWYKLLRAAKDHKVTVCLLNEFNDGCELQYMSWILEMYKSTTIGDLTYGHQPEKKKIDLPYEIKVGDYFPFGKHRGCRIDLHPSMVGYFNWLIKETTCVIDPKIIAYVNHS